MSLFKYFFFLIIALYAINPTRAQDSLGRPVVSYQAHTYDCSNTTVETVIFNDTLLAGVWTNGGDLTIHLLGLSFQNSGGSANLTLKVKVDGQTITTLNNVAQANSGVLGRGWRGLTMERYQDTVLVYFAAGVPVVNTLNLTQGFVSIDTFSGTTGTTLTTLNFGTDKVIEVTAQWSVANANTFIKVPQGKLVLTP